MFIHILSTAEVLKYSNAIKRLISQQIENPEEHFINYILSQVYEGRRTQKVKDKFKDIIKKSIFQVINGMVRNKLENALATKEETEEELEEQTEEIEFDSENNYELIKGNQKFGCPLLYLIVFCCFN